MLINNHDIHQSTVFYDPAGRYQLKLLEELMHAIKHPCHIIGLDSILQLHPSRLLGYQINDLCPHIGLQNIQYLADQVGIPPSILVTPPKYLCPGYKQLCVLFRTLLLAPKYVIFEEPTHHLNPNMLDVAHQCIKHLHDKKSIIFIITQQNNFSYLNTLQVSPPPFHKNNRINQKSTSHLLSISNLYLKRQQLLFIDTSFHIPTHHTVGLFGPNGCGKSSLIDAICQLIPYRGSIKVSGQDILSIRNLTHRLSIMHQNITTSFNPQIPIYQSLQNIVLLRQEMALYDIDQSYLNKYPHEIPYSQLKSILLLSTCLEDTDLTIFDEPTFGLNQALKNHLQRHLQGRSTNLVISHDRTFLEQNCQSIWFVDKHKMTIRHV